ncbi:hypothetical protein QT995_24095 [Microcoleus sp. S36b_A3]
MTIAKILFNFTGAIASQFVTFAIANNLSELNNKVNYFCLLNLE